MGRQDERKRSAGRETDSVLVCDRGGYRLLSV